MNAELFRHFYGYHFAENRKIWDAYIVPLSDRKFTQEMGYSIGSVRNQIVHLVSVDEAWFSGMRGDPIPDWLDPADFDDRGKLRAHWDLVEQKMRADLAALQDEDLFDQPFLEEEDRGLFRWQALLQAANHGTDHRAQILRLLNDLGVETTAQDYIFYVYETMEPGV